MQPSKADELDRLECAAIVARLSAREVFDFVGIGGHVSPHQLAQARNEMFLLKMDKLARRVAGELALAGLQRQWEGAGGGAPLRRATTQGPVLGFHPDRRTREHRIAPHGSIRRAANKRKQVAA